MTTFALVHGAWHDGTCWDEVRALLEARGHAVITPDLPIDDPEATIEDYAAVVEDALAGTGGDVVLVGHSMGSETVPVVAARRPARMVVYVTPSLSRLPRPDGAPRQTRENLQTPPIEAGAMTWTEAEAVRVMYPRVPAERARTLAAALRPQALGAMGRPYPIDAAPDVPAALIYTTDDELIEPAYARWAAEHVLGVAPIELPGGHFPMNERPEELAGLLVELAER